MPKALRCYFPTGVRRAWPGIWRGVEIIELNVESNDVPGQALVDSGYDRAPIPGPCSLLEFPFGLLLSLVAKVPSSIGLGRGFA